MNLISKLLVVICAATVGCGAPSSGAKSATPSDPLLESLVSQGPISGFWSSPGFAGEFRNLEFVTPTGTGSDRTYQLKGTGELWSKDGSIPFTITGTCRGRMLKPTLNLQTKVVDGEGELTADVFGLPACSIVFKYNGLPYPAKLNCVDDIAKAKSAFLEAGQ